MPKPGSTSTKSRSNPPLNTDSTHRKRSRSNAEPTHPPAKKRLPIKTAEKGPVKSKSKSSSTTRVRQRTESRSSRPSVLKKAGEKRGGASARAESSRAVVPAVSLDSVDSAPSVPEPKSRRGRKEVDDEEGSGSGTDYDSDEEGWTEDDREAAGGRDEKRKQAASKEGRREEKEEFMIDGKAVSVDQVKMMLRLIGKTASEGVGAIGKEDVGAGAEDVVLEEGEGELVVELEMSEEDEDEYEDIGRGFRQELEEQLQFVNKGNKDLIAGYTADKAVKNVSTCLKQRQGEVILNEYKAWIHADQKYKPEIKQHWDAMIKPLDQHTKAQAEIIRKLEAAVMERMKVVAEARKAFTNKSDEHKFEIEGYQTELDKSQKKAVKAYRKFTDEEAIGKDIGMKLKDAMNAYADNLIVGRQARGKKRKAEVEEDEEEEEEEVEE